jgi:pimeloyl-ACP methyl ester carboxylesterase
MPPTKCLARLAAVAAVIAAAVVIAPTAVGSGAVRAFSPVERVQVGDATIAYRSIGAGPPLVLVMGFAGTMFEWDPLFLRELARSGRRVIVFDNRGLGHSSAPDGEPITIQQMADDAVGMARALGLGRFDLAGWSMGGQIAKAVVLRHPNLVRRRILLGTDPGGPRSVPATRAAMRVLDDPDATAAQFIRIIFPVTRPGLAAARRYGIRLTRQPDMTAASFASPAAVIAKQVRAEARWGSARGGVHGRLPRLRVPVLVAGALDDIVEPPENSLIIAQRAPKASIRLYPRSGHAFMFQYPRRVAADIDAFPAGRARL